jgi:hypothetical protein
MASDKLYEIQSIIDESKETLSSELYNKLSIACKKSFNERKNEKMFIRVKIMFFCASTFQDESIIIPKFRYEVIPVTPHQFDVLIERQEQGKFTTYRSPYCKEEQTELIFNDRKFCNGCDEYSDETFQIRMGEYIVYATKHIDTGINWLSTHANTNKVISGPEFLTPQNE